MPDFSTVCRRQKTLRVQLAYRQSTSALDRLPASVGMAPTTPRRACGDCPAQERPGEEGDLDGGVRGQRGAASVATGWAQHLEEVEFVFFIAISSIKLF